MLMNYLREGIGAFIYLAPIAIIVFAIFNGIKFLIQFLFKRKIEIHILIMLCEFLWILTILAILEITGIVGGDFGTTSLFNGTAAINFSLFEESLSMATLLNIVLFIPFGFFLPIIFKQLKNNRPYGILIGLVFSIIIEFLQTFTGRFVQLDDILMNTFGTFIGYRVCFLLAKLKLQSKTEQ